MSSLRLVHNIPGQATRLRELLPPGLVNAPQLSVPPNRIGTQLRRPIGSDALNAATLLIDQGMERQFWVGVAWNCLKTPNNATQFRLGFGIGMLERIGAVSVINVLHGANGRKTYVIPQEGLVDLFS